MGELEDMKNPDVKIVRWPAESGKLARFRMQGLPCLIVVARGAQVPELTGTHEDWVRHPAETWELQARVASLRHKAMSRSTAPMVDEDGLLRYGSEILPLTVSEAEVFRGLLHRRPGIASRSELAERLLYANRSASQNALDLHIMRLRRKVDSIGLAIETVRGRGFLLKART
ncbi:winged helix-turn-helix domain-containing protein [Streptomyces sp. NPDC090493]|uniref:winged helix-turn-helix domain-containing protein n=1 Tax=Streptomyces sp. NPDC090493 TaxID=3365964 RepID=UPI003823D3C6